MILVANLFPSAFFRDKRMANVFFKIALGRMLLSSRVNICSAKRFLKLSEATTSVFLKISQISPENTGIGVSL